MRSDAQATVSFHFKKHEKYPLRDFNHGSSMPIESWKQKFSLRQRVRGVRITTCLLQALLLQKMYGKWLKITFFAKISSFLPLNQSFNGSNALFPSEGSFGHPPDQFLDFHYFHRGLTVAVLGANLTKNGSLYLYTNIYEPQNPIKRIRINFGSQSGHLEYLQIIFWSLTLLTRDSLGLFFGQIRPKMVHFTYMLTHIRLKT